MTDPTATSPPAAEPPVGVIGGSGLYSLLEGAREVEVDTPWGAPSSPVTCGDLGGTPVAFLTRHGREHAVPPHLVNYRANLAALHQLGVRDVVSSSAVGALHPGYSPGDFVLPHQLIDRTHGRPDTFDEGAGFSYVPFADPYDSRARALTRTALAGIGEDRVHPRGTVVVIQGPRFSTRAESHWFRAAGGDVVSMTAYPEAVLAAQLGVRLVNLALVTDADAGDEEPEEGATPDPDAAERVEAVTAEAVFALLEQSQPRIRAAIAAIAAAFAADRRDSARAADGADGAAAAPGEGA